MSPLTEQTLDTTQLVDGALLKVFRDKVQLPDGSESIREWINHPGAAAIVPFFDDGNILLVRQYRYPPRKLFLEVPAGKFDHPGEEAAEVAIRELEEETGWIPGKVVPVGAFYPGIGYSNEIIHFFIGTELSEGRQNFSHGEFVEVVRIPFDEALQMVQRGEILDMKTVTALLYTDVYLKAHPETLSRNGL